MIYDEIYNQIVESFVYISHTYRCIVVDNSRGIKYNLMIHTTPLETKFSISLMFKESHYHLLRFDFGDQLRHTNPDNTVIKGSHLYHQISILQNMHTVFQI